VLDEADDQAVAGPVPARPRPLGGEGVGVEVGEDRVDSHETTLEVARVGGDSVRILHTTYPAHDVFARIEQIVFEALDQAIGLDPDSSQRRWLLCENSLQRRQHWSGPDRSWQVRTDAIRVCRRPRPVDRSSPG